MKCALIAVLLAGTMTGMHCSGQSLSTARSSQFPRFRLRAGQVDADGLPTSGAKLCLLAQQNICYQMPSETYPNSAVTYQFGLEPRSERLTLVDGGSWVFFSAMFSGGGSGTLTRFAVLRYEGGGKFGQVVNPIPWVGATNVSDWAMWNVPSASAYPVFIHADFIWGDGETHFAPHFYTVEAWKFDPGTDRYTKAFDYKTGRKYVGGDDGPVRVLEPEREQIVSRLESKHE